MKRRTTPTGPSSASTSRERAEDERPRSTARRTPKSSSESAPAAAAMMISSNVAQPRHCSDVQHRSRAYEPRWPSGARMSTIDGTRASAPIMPATPSMRLPISAADEDREQRLAERERRHEQRADDEHEQRDAEVPQSSVWSTRLEHSQPLRHRLDAPTRRFSCHSPPFAGMTRIRF